MKENFPTSEALKISDLIAKFGWHLPYRDAPCLQSGSDPRIKEPSTYPPGLVRGVRVGCRISLGGAGAGKMFLSLEELKRYFKMLPSRFGRRFRVDA